MTTITAREFLALPSTDLPGAAASFGGEDYGAAVAWTEIRHMAETGEPSIFRLHATSTQWSGRRRVVCGERGQ